MPIAPRPLRDRFMEKVEIKPNGGCWEWTAARTANGYGRIWVLDARCLLYAHRVSYELFVGPIPEGLEIDHACRNRGCVNPRHLEAVTRRENQHRGVSFSGNNARLKRCPQGHPYDETNTYHPPTGGRQCVTCRREQASKTTVEYKRAWREANRDRVNAHKREWRAKRRAAGLPH